jgi:hypothetical protein
MKVLKETSIAAAVWLRLLRTRLASDRGDNPIPTAVIVVGFVLIAVTVLTLLGALVRGYIAQAPTSVPNP